MINYQWLELPISRTNFNGLKAVRVIEVRLYDMDIRDQESLHSVNEMLQYIKQLITDKIVRINSYHAW